MQPATMAFPGRWWHEPDAEDGEDDGAYPSVYFTCTSLLATVPRTLLIALRCLANNYSISADID